VFHIKLMRCEPETGCRIMKWKWRSVSMPKNRQESQHIALGNSDLCLYAWLYRGYTGVVRGVASVHKMQPTEAMQPRLREVAWGCGLHWKVAKFCTLRLHTPITATIWDNSLFLSGDRHGRQWANGVASGVASGDRCVRRGQQRVTMVPTSRWIIRQV